MNWFCRLGPDAACANPCAAGQRSDLVPDCADAGARSVRRPSSTAAGDCAPAAGSADRQRAAAGRHAAGAGAAANAGPAAPVHTAAPVCTGELGTLPII